jgi:FimV-like protein
LNPENTLALVGVGDSFKFAKRFDEAQPYYEKALALEPENASIELDYAEYFLDRARASNGPEEVTTYLTEARRHFLRSYKIDPQNPETLAMNGASYLRPGESMAKALESLKAAHAMLPSQAQIKYLLAAAYVMNGEPEKAEPMLRSVIAWGAGGTAEEATKLLQQLSTPKASEGPGATVDPPSTP